MLKPPHPDLGQREKKVKFLFSYLKAQQGSAKTKINFYFNTTF